LRSGPTDEEYRWKTIRKWGKALMVGKRVQFDDETWQAIEAVADETGKPFQELADEAFADLLKKHNVPIDLKDALRKSAKAVDGKPAKQSTAHPRRVRRPRNREG
jgi:hypothetical protein